jgi:simple sugar transport system permease protein
VLVDTGVHGASRRRSVVTAVLRERPETGALVAAIALIAVFSMVANHFLSMQSVASMATVAAELGILAMAVTALMVAGEFDLSVGSILGFSSMLVAWLINHADFPAAAAILCGLAAGTLMGVINGVIVATTRVPSFVVTLGAMLFWRGVGFVLTDALTLSLTSRSPVFAIFSYRFDNGLQMSAIWFIVLLLVWSAVMLRTKFGNWIFASGGNERAARGLGVPVDRVRITLFGLTGMSAALVGVIQLGEYHSVDSLRGTGVELNAIAATAIGGARLYGGYGSVVGTALGCIIVAVINNGLVLAGVASYWYSLAIGLLIVLSVVINQLLRRRNPAA